MPLQQYHGLHQNVFMLAVGFESSAMFVSGTLTLSCSLTLWHYGRCRNLASLTIAAHSSLAEAFNLHLRTPVSRRSFSTSSSHFSYFSPAFSCHLDFPLSNIFSILLFHTLAPCLAYPSVVVLISWASCLCRSPSSVLVLALVLTVVVKISDVTCSETR